LAEFIKFIKMTLLITLIFVFSYIFIVLEHPIKINKSAFALLGGVLCWAAYIMMTPDKNEVGNQLLEHLSDVSSILFFLMGAMTIVELIDAHDGFEVITSKIKTKNITKVLWIIGVITFLLSSVLDNLTTTIVMISLTRKIVQDAKQRLFFASLIVIAANAGGAWSPIGDVTTTMLWIGGQITTWKIMVSTFLASSVCLILPMIFITPKLKSIPLNEISKEPSEFNATERNLVFFLGIGALIFVPVFKTITNLPPFMGILFGLGILWIVTEIIHRNKVVVEREPLTVMRALQRIDLSSILFFFGILMSIAALQSIGQLKNIAQYLDLHFGNHSIIALILGVLSAIIDNVPLVAASMGMYDMTLFPPDHYFWELIAYTTGTGGSILIIGSAAGVAAMGMEKIEFFWYLKNISWLAFLGYIGGALVYLLQHGLLF
jgi:Na+/H+ antiporter NhaD/arsenite permease-like protein